MPLAFQQEGGSITIVSGDILNSEEKYLCHQTNCAISNGKAKGIAQSIFERYPYANIYTPESSAVERKVPGEIIIKGNGEDCRYVINMCCQRYPGKSKYSNDSKELRQQWFQDALIEISKIENLDSIAFPYGIGCGYGGGDWNQYLLMLQEFAAHVNARVVIYKLD